MILYVYWLMDDRNSEGVFRPVMKSLKMVTNLPKMKFMRGSRTPATIIQTTAMAVVTHPIVSLYLKTRYKDQLKSR